MKKICTILLLFVFSIIFMCNVVYAADELSFNLTYTGDVVKGEQKDATVVLKGVGAPTYTNVRIKVDVTGPAVPSFIAYDSQGTRFDIAELGYWGPDAGFAVAGDFENTTPIQATFPEEGQYTVTLSLINVANNNDVITSKAFTINVEDNLVDNDVNDVNDTNDANNVTEIPTTGTTLGQYAVMCAVIFAVCYVGYFIYKRKV